MHDEYNRGKEGCGLPSRARDVADVGGRLGKLPLGLGLALGSPQLLTARQGRHRRIANRECGGSCRFHGNKRGCAEEMSKGGHDGVPDPPEKSGINFSVVDDGKQS